MRVPSVAPCGAVPWVPSNEVQRGNGIGETPRGRGKVALNKIIKDRVCLAEYFILLLIDKSI